MSETPKVINKYDIALPESMERGAHTVTVLGNHIVFVSTSQDEDAGNPCDDWDDMGKVYSFCRKHSNFLRDFEFPAARSEAPAALKEHFNPDIVILGYFEHGACVWHVSGRSPRGTEGDYRWDGVSFAGVWVPDKYIIEEADKAGLTGEARTKFMEERAAHTCETYTQYCNGDVYGYTIDAYTVRKTEDGVVYDELSDYRHAKAAYEDSTCGHYGYDNLQASMLEAANTCGEALGL